MMKKNNSQGLSESDELYAQIHEFQKNDDAGGGGLEHPGLVSADACRPAGLLEEGGYTSGLLRLVLRLDRTVPGCCEFGAACYTQDWNPMAETLRYVANGRGRRLSFNLHTDRIWVPGEYFVVVSQNGEPFAKVVFRYDGKETSPGRCCLFFFGGFSFFPDRAFPLGKLPVVVLYHGLCLAVSCHERPYIGIAVLF